MSVFSPKMDPEQMNKCYSSKKSLGGGTFKMAEE